MHLPRFTDLIYLEMNLIFEIRSSNLHLLSKDVVLLHCVSLTLDTLGRGC